MGDLGPHQIHSVPWAAGVCACLATSLPPAGESSPFFLWGFILPLLPGPGAVLIG